MNNDIQKIITDGVKAPSGENCQPWKFIVEGNKISIFIIPEADQSLYNFEQKGSLVAHGALIENIVISASHFGYRASVAVLPDKNIKNLVSVVTLEKSAIKEDDLYQVIPLRGTNRKENTPVKLNNDQKKALIENARGTGFGEFKIIDDQPSLDKAGKAIALNERIIFENKALHTFFYNHILWNENEQYKAGGFYIKTLEFLPHQLKAVKIFKSWAILKIFNIAGVSKAIEKENAEKYAKSAALGVIVIQASTDKDYINAGRAVERVWLTATKLGLSIHPCTGVLYFKLRIDGGDTASFSKEHLKAIDEAYHAIEDTFGVQGKKIPMLMRLGYADAPSARAMRMEPQIEYK